MNALLTTVVAVSGAGLALWGFVGALRHRHRVRGRAGSPRARRVAVIAYAVGGLLVLVPDLIAGLVVAGGPSSSQAVAVVGFLVATIYRLFVVVLLGLGAAAIGLTSRGVTTRVHRGATEVSTVIARVPRPVDLTHARMRRQAGMGSFPREWESLIEHDRSLARRLLEQGNHFEPTAHHGVLRDFSDPVTVAAMEALVECDRVRTPLPPRGTRDVLATDYGRAVAAFEAAVVAAEANATQSGTAQTSAAHTPARTAAQSHARTAV